ncbi:MAG TPA: hypothetical protein VNE19_08415 [Methylomirabilota bacterium]|jgi:hypothetical protein|nr:hypothetical protein [Methylomirabilota bacterium]
MNAWQAVSRELRQYDSAVLATRDAEGYPVTVRCVPAPDADRAALVVRIPDGLGVQAGPAWLLCHFHDRQFWGLRSFGSRGWLERADGGWLFRPTAFVPGMGGVVAMVRMFVGGRRRAYRYLAAQHVEPPDIRWDLINEAKARAKEHVRSIREHAT